MSNAEFRALAKDAGLPTTEEEIRAEFEKILDDEELVITNNSPFSPLWRFIQAIAVKPVLWLVEFIIGFVLVQSFIATATGVYLQLHGRSFGLEFKTKKKARGNLTFTRESSAGELIIAAGTVVQSNRINGRVFSLVSLNDGVFSDGVSSIDILFEAVAAGSDYNLGQNSYTVLEVALDGVDVTNVSDWLVSPGDDDETNEEFRARILNLFSTPSLFHTDSAYRAIISTFPGVLLENIFFLYRTRGPASADIYVMLEAGRPDETFIQVINQHVRDEGNHGLGDDVIIYAIPESVNDVGCTVWFNDDVGDEQKADSIAEITNIIRSAFRENSEYDVTKVRPNKLFGFSILADEIQNFVPGIANLVFSPTFIEPGLNIAKLGTLTVLENA